MKRDFGAIFTKHESSLFNL